MESPLYDQWINEGYIVVPQLFSAECTARLRTICDRILEQWRVTDPQTGEAHNDPNANCMRHLNHPAYYSGRSDEFVELMRAAADRRCWRSAWRSWRKSRCSAAPATSSIR